jgi:putative transposase
MWKGQPAQVMETVPGDLARVVIELTRSNETKVVKIAELRPRPEDLPSDTTVDLAILNEGRFENGKAMFRNLVGPLLQLAGRRTTAEVKRLAELAGVSRTTAYRKLEVYQKTGTVASLMPYEKTGGRGKSRLHPKVYGMTLKVCNQQLDTANGTTLGNVMYHLRCAFDDKRNGLGELSLPHENTVGKILRRLEDEKKTGRMPRRKRHLKRGTVNANWPGSTCQMDHGYLDILILDPIYREEIGRPWITLLIDCCTRMVMGFYLSLDFPSAASAGMCVANAICMKDAYLKEIGLPDAVWPWWGTFNLLHVDNAKEFRGNTLKRGCDQHDLKLHWRPVANPTYGGHIERMMGTVAGEMKLIPGTTFSNYKEKGDYESAKEAAMTLEELERYLVTWFLEAYHQREHSELGMSPLQKLEQMRRFGSDEYPACGDPDPVKDEQRLRYDFMPFEERTVQTDGVRLNHIYYRHDVLRPFVKRKDPATKKTQTFIFRKDPRNIKFLHFWNPDTNRYHGISYRNTSGPAMSIHEHRAIVKALRARKVRQINEDHIFDTWKKLRQQIEQAKATTGLTRKQKRHEAIRETNMKLTAKAKDSEKETNESDDSADAASEISDNAQPARPLKTYTVDLDI